MFKKKTVTLLASLILILCVTVGGTLAYLVDITDAVTNLFTPAEVTTYVQETLEGNAKKDVKIQNTGNTRAWIRAYYVVTWQNNAGEVYGKLPVAVKGENQDGDYTIDMGTGWLEGTDGFYYWYTPVKCDDESTTDCYTGNLINFIAPVAEKAPDGYTLHVEIIGSGVQSRPVSAFNAWAANSGITINSGGTQLVQGG